MSDCVALTRDVNNNTLKKTSTATCFNSLYHLQSPHQSSLTQAIEPKKEPKPKERRQLAAPAPEKPQAEYRPGERQAKGYKNDFK